MLYRLGDEFDDEPPRPTALCRACSKAFARRAKLIRQRDEREELHRLRTELGRVVPGTESLRAKLEEARAELARLRAKHEECNDCETIGGLKRERDHFVRSYDDARYLLVRVTEQQRPSVKLLWAIRDHLEGHRPQFGPETREVARLRCTVDAVQQALDEWYPDDGETAADVVDKIIAIVKEMP